jgi:hypothetical protein
MFRTKHSLEHPEHDVHVNKHSGFHDIKPLEFRTNILRKCTAQGFEIRNLEWYIHIMLIVINSY